MKKILSDIPFISQLGTYPTGCESVSCTMALQHLGWKGTVDDFIALLPKAAPPCPGPDGSYVGPDPEEFFPGDPYSPDGWGCFAPCLAATIQQLPGYRTIIYRGLPLATVKSFIDAGEPVVFWGTIEFRPPRKTLAWLTPKGRRVQWVSPMHCTLLIGYDEGGFYFNDPTGGKDAYYSLAEVKAGYEAQGSQIMIVRKDEANASTCLTL